MSPLRSTQPVLLRGFVLACFLGILITALTQEFRVTKVEVGDDLQPRIMFPGTNGFYYILREGATVTSILTATDVVLGTNAEGVLLGRPLMDQGARFFRVEARDITESSDLDGDGLLDVYELLYPDILNPLNPLDAFEDPDRDGCNNLCEAREGTNPRIMDQITQVTTSPSQGESGVAVTRETIIRFSQPLAEGTVIGADTLYATALGRRILSRVEISGDKRSVTLFHLENLPGDTRVRVELHGHELRDVLGVVPDVDGDGRPGGHMVLTYDTLSNKSVPGTAIRGRVFASEIAGAGAINVPLEGVTITVDGAEETLRTSTDVEGNFVLTNCPAGRFFVHVDGRTAVGSQWPDGGYYPYVGKAWTAIGGRDDNLAGNEPHADRTGDIYLPLIAQGSLKAVSALSETIVTFPQSVLAQNPRLVGVEVRVPPNSLFSDSGTRGGRVGIAPVPPDRLPEPLPSGLELPLVITIQTDGPSNFDVPVPVRFPNLSDSGTGMRLSPGAKSALWSFNHDTGRWMMQGPMTVTADGMFVESDFGYGVTQPGWHGAAPGTTSSGPRRRVVYSRPPGSSSGAPLDTGTLGNGPGGRPVPPDSPIPDGEGDPGGGRPRGGGPDIGDAEGGGPNGGDPGGGDPGGGDPGGGGGLRATGPGGGKGSGGPVSRSDCDAMISGPFLEAALAPAPNIPMGQASPTGSFAVTDVVTTLGEMSFIIRNSKGTPVGGPFRLTGVSPSEVTWAYSPDDSSLAVHYVTGMEGGNFMRAVHLYALTGNQAGKRILARSIISNEFPPRIGFSPNGQYLYYGGYSARRELSMHLADTKSGVIVHTVRISNTSASQNVTIGFSPDKANRGFVIAQNVGSGAFFSTTWTLLNLHNGRTISGSYEGRPSRMGDFLFSPAGETLSVFRQGGTAPAVSLYSVHDGKIIRSQEASSGTSVVAKPDGYYVGSIRVTDNLSARDCRILDSQGNSKVDVRAARPSQDGGAEEGDDGEELFTEASMGRHVFALYNRETGTTVQRGEFNSTEDGLLELILAPNTVYELSIASFETLATGTLYFISGVNGMGTLLPDLEMGADLLDSDEDGLSDVFEYVIGTNPMRSDTDGDGVPDGVEVRNGTDPLDNRPATTGVIASQPLPAGALDICAFDNRAIVAMGSGGIGVLNVFNGLNPTLIAQVDTPGSAHQVACAGDLVAVADGASGLALVDISTPANATLVRQFSSRELGGGDTRSVAMAADLVFAGQSVGVVSVIEASSGVVMQRMELGGSVTSLAVEGVTLHAVAGGRLWVLPFGEGILEKRGHLQIQAGRLFVGNGIAHVASGGGFRIYDVSNPDAPVAMDRVDTTQMNWKQMVPTGSGYGLGVVGINPGEEVGDSIYLYDLRNGVNSFVTRLNTPGVARAVSLFNGLGYVADGGAGLQVVNYLPYDALNQPPTGRLVLSATNEVTAGGYVVVRAEVEDDVQVRNVEFFLDGERIATDGNFPFELVYRVPISRVGATLTFSARVFDTGGNASTLTNLSAISVVPDVLPPLVQIESPSPNTRFFVGDDILVVATIRDNVGIQRVEIRVDGRPVRTQRLSGIEYLILENLPSGSHGLVVVATDNSGLTTESVTVPFEIWRRAISREYTAFSVGVQDGRPQAISREYSAFGSGPQDDRPQAISREYSALHVESQHEKPQAISREYSASSTIEGDGP